jgi:hypothetical protein
MIKTPTSKKYAALLCHLIIRASFAIGDSDFVILPRARRSHFLRNFNLICAAGAEKSFTTKLW